MKKWAGAAIVIALLLWSGAGVRFDFSLFKDIGNSFRFIRDNWFPLDTEDAGYAVGQMVLTLQIALFSTLIAVGIALPASFFAARNTTPFGGIYHGIRAVFNFLRSVPEIVMALVFIPTLGLGPMPAVLALIIHNIGVFGKMISELIESVDRGPQEAVQSAGGTRILVALYGIMPQIIPLVISQYFYRLEVAIRTCLILGVVGAGGLGQLLYNDFKMFAYQRVAFEVVLIMLLVTSVDYLGAYVRKRVN
ncbi:phosphonate ABC transporter, permease protein PhnE [Paenibacillus aurantius]|uniref:Phosphonate ABC transporter, permease protein PhnE n=1 Tax=Paenibacillus aurantius TaxID=2918900 RepID=A0AA96RBV4_9BACL|nr:phosphonate ABC transporter, permease protein PhnE [Paenibacillus aurantius]WNQ09820.1 phosphonate ABC transporter, permease protein PhnE [Paenibacillus aurantius]